MGFSLELFFKELQTIMTESISDGEKLNRIQNAIEENLEYAIECNAL